MSTSTISDSLAHALATSNPDAIFNFTGGVVDTELPQLTLDGLVTSAPPSNSKVQNILDTQIVKINQGFSRAVRLAVGGTPSEEIATWIYQADEAQDVIDQKGNATPFLDGMLAELSLTGMTIDLLAQKILAAEESYKQVIAPLVGKRQLLVASVKAIDLLSPTAAADIAAIEWV